MTFGKQRRIRATVVVDIDTNLSGENAAELMSRIELMPEWDSTKGLNRFIYSVGVEVEQVYEEDQQ